MATMYETKYDIPEGTDVITLIKDAKKVFYKDLNVIGVGIGNKNVFGEIRKNEIALIVYVKTKQKRNFVKQEYLIPDEFQGMITDVVAPFRADAPIEALGFIEGYQESGDMSNIDLTRLHLQWKNEEKEEKHWKGRIQVKDDICIIEDDGSLVKNINGKETVDFIQAYKLFRSKHPDIYEFVTFFTDSDQGMPPQGGSSWYQPVFNDIDGIGLDNINRRDVYDSKILEGIMFINEGHFSKWRHVMLQEQGQRWSSYARYKDTASGSIKNDHLHAGRAHWSLNFGDEKSPMDFNIYNLESSNGNFTRTALKTEERSYCNLDLYLMGLLEKEKVGEFNLLSSVSQVSGEIYSADKKTLTVKNIIMAEGERKPDVSRSKKMFRNAFVVITGDINKSKVLVDNINLLRLKFEEDFYNATKKLGKVDTSLKSSLIGATTNFKNVRVEIPKGTGKRNLTGSVTFDSNVLSAGIALNGFKIESENPETLSNSFEIETKLIKISGDTVDFNIECNTGSKKLNEPYKGHVSILVIAEVN